MDRINITTYEKRLQSVALSDSEWKYGRDLKLPEPNVLDRHSLITAISLVSAATGSNISIRLQKLNPNRATQGLKPSDLLSVSFSSFRPSHDEKGEPTRWTTKETTGYITRLLRTGVEIHDIRYNFYGYSNSQLKSRTTLLLAAPKDVITQRIESFGDFSKMKTVAKKAKRIGLLFSSAEAVMTVDPARCEDVPDVENDNYIFTDGCGLISPRFAQELSRRLRICFRAKRYSPSVFQIRYKGYKGVLTIDPTMKDPRVLMKFRKSMKKFTGGDDNSFSIVEYAKPYVYGHLNDEVVILLNSLGISAETLLRKQKEHFAFLELAPKDPLAAFRFLCHVNKPDLAEKLLLESIDAVKPEILKLVKAEKGKMLSKRDTQKCRILVPKSRLLFGVCDAWGVLKPGECHVKVTTDLRGEPQTLINAHVLVTRNPCLHPGDLQKLKVVEHPALAHLVDCIVFPIKGKRPSADMMSGGDLDGDTCKSSLILTLGDSEN
ncbi:RNA-dependent RNA polymerase [Poronia punctata]|nr:RNA-dependent RNA polymerase [Poronia punctata]